MSPRGVEIESRPKSKARVNGWPVSITRQHGPLTRVMETGI